jgi:tRNA dimethylallyltransferase
MEVCTDKISKEAMYGVPHYMLSIVDPDDDFSVSAYQKSVMNLLKSIARKNMKTKSPVVPFIVGGTGLYVSAIVDGYEFSNIVPDLKLREELNSQDLDKLVKTLKKLDPETMVDIKNKRRVVRALEILQGGGKLPTKTQPPFQILKLGLGENRQKSLHQIHERVYGIKLEALVKETKKLIRTRYKFTLPALSALGYTDVKDFIDNKISQKELRDRLMKLHSQYAKRQMTWFKRDKDIKWIKNIHEAETLVSQFLFN